MGCGKRRKATCYRASLIGDAGAMFESARTRAGPGNTLVALPMKGLAMLYTIVVILLVLWALGLVTSYTMGGLIHILLVVAIIVLIVNFVSGRRV
jgi:Family of unknown function (DUF5670)